MPESPYEMTIGVGVLHHLGLNLYSNVPAVLSEAVANAWDADATRVDVTSTPTADQIIIEDNGDGMTLRDLNQRFLYVSYSRRIHQPGRTRLRRLPMGRKGIGKLSLFSIANTVEVFTARRGERHALRMSREDIEAHVRKSPNSKYRPKRLDPDLVTTTKGTRIVLSDLKRSIDRTEQYLRRRLARRFGVIGDAYKFEVRVNGRPITLDDRDYFADLEAVWWYGDAKAKYGAQCVNATDERQFDRNNKVQVGGKEYRVSGWIGTVKKSGKLRSDNLNAIAVTVRGKVAEEDILGGLGESGVYAQFVIGELEAGFLDLDKLDDIATSNRQQMKEDDPRYQSLRSFIRRELKNVEKSWTSIRDRKAVDEASENPAVKEWYKSLSMDDRKRAQRLLGNIGKLAAPADDRTVLYQHAILAFENLKYKEKLDLIETISIDSLEKLAALFEDLDELEATLYHKIVRQRLEVIFKLEQAVDANALEMVLRNHLFDHLWLLDPSWERAAGSAEMEKRIDRLFKNEVDPELSKAERAARLDIRYKKTSRKHVIIELKRAGRDISVPGELTKQVAKYNSVIDKLLLKQSGGKAALREPFEIICVVGKLPSGWDDAGVANREAASLASYNARVVTYEQLLKSAHDAYEEFLREQEKRGRLQRLLETIADAVRADS